MLFQMFYVISQTDHLNISLEHSFFNAIIWPVCSTATATCLVVRKWLFSLKLEVRLAESLDTARSWLFWQAVDDVNKGQIKPGNQLYQLKALQVWALMFPCFLHTSSKRHYVINYVLEYHRKPQPLQYQKNYILVSTSPDIFLFH